MFFCYNKKMTKYNEIVEYAKSKFPNAEAVVSAYTMHMIWVSEKLARISGYTQAELVDRSIRDVVMIDAATLISFVTGRDKETQKIRTKSGKLIQGTTDIRTFKYKGELYFVTYDSHFEELD